MNVACLHVSVQNLLSIRLVSKDINIKIYGTIVLPSWFVCVKPGVVTLKNIFCGVFRKRLRGMLGPKTEEVRETLKLHNLEVCDLYSSRKIWVIKSKRMRLVGYIIYRMFHDFRA